MSVPALKRAITGALGLAILWPAGALAAPSGADRDHDKVADGLEKHIEHRSSATKVRLIVSLDRRATEGTVEGLEDNVGDMSVRHRFRYLKGVALTATKAQVERLARQGVVTQIGEDRPVHVDAGGFGTSTALNDDPQSSFGVTEAQLDDPLLDGSTDGAPATYTPADEVAAVIDTGIDASHPNLDGGKVLAFVQCLNPPPIPDPAPSACVDQAPYDDNGHGTHVAGTIAGDGGGSNPAGRGVAPGAGLVGVKVLDSHGNGYSSDVAAGIEWVIANKDTYGIDAINLSLGSEACDNDVHVDSQAVNLAYAQGLLVSVAAGNDGPGTCTIDSPGDAKDALTVGAMADLGADGFRLADFSSRGPTFDGRIKPDITAPGLDIASTYPITSANPSGYKVLSGTSMATPFVTGVALLMLDADPTFVNDDVKDAITSTAVDWGRGGDETVGGSIGPDIDYGAGRLDAYQALRVADPVNLSSNGGPQVPRHSLREGSLSGTGALLDYAVDVASTSFPIAATMINLPSSCRSGGSHPDFSLRLIAPNGTSVAYSDSTTDGYRQEQVGYLPTVRGVYTLRVSSFADCGDFFMDVSGGEVSMQGTAGQPEPGPDPSQPTPPPAGPSTAPAPVATAALLDAARLNAKRAARALKKSGLRRLLKKRSFVLRGLAPSAGRLELVVRATYRGHTVTVAKLTRKVSSAGQPRLTVRLTRSGRRLLARPGRRRRLSVRAAVTDSATGRRRLAGYKVLVRR
jgi:serine protease AprX